LRISADGIGSISGRLLLGTAEIIPSEELIDTTGAGDAFIGAVLYGQYVISNFFMLKIAGFMLLNCSFC
jgi:hypothetical protein